MEKIKLGDLCKPSAGQIKEDEDTLIDYIDISSVDNETKKVTGYQTITFGEAPSRARKAVRRGNVLVSTVRPNLNAVALLEEDTPNVSVASTGFCVLESKDDVDPRFILNFCKSKPFIDDMVSQATGASYPAVSDKIVRSALVPKYSYQEQQHISTVLDKLAGIIDDRRIELQQLDDLIKARFVELFGDPVENPKGYRVDTLQALIDAGDITYHLDGNHGGDYPRSEEFVSEGVPYIGANCISNGEIDFSLAKYLTEERAGKLRKGIAQDEDVLFAHNATVGPTVVLHTTEPKVILSTSLTAYRCNKDSIMPEYLATYMKSEGFVMQYSSEMKQTTRNQVPITAQKKYLFLIPPMEEQKSFSEFVKQVDKSKDAVKKSLDEAKLLFDSLMQEYFG